MKILFQGDSITDFNRQRDNTTYDLGKGYVNLVSARLGKDYPEKYQFYNYGISGDRVVDVYARIKRDCWNYNPDVISFLIGVNDVWHEYDFKNGVDAKRFENIYDLLIQETKERLPKARIIIMGAYLCKGEALTDKYEEFLKEVKLRAEAAERVAKKYDCEFISLQDVFDKAVKQAPDSYWTIDGVHPTPFGHQLIADEWIKNFLK